MKRILGLSLALFFVGAAPAWAVCPGALQLKDNAGVTANGKYTDDGSGNCQAVVVLGANQGEVGTPATGFSQPTGGTGLSGWLSGIQHVLNDVWDSSNHWFQVKVMNANANGAAAPASASPVTPSNQPVGGGTIVTNQVSVGTTVGGTQIIAARTGVAGTGRISATVCNTSTTDVWVGASGLTTATGQLLDGIKGACITLNTTAAIFGIVGSGTETVSFSETF